MKRTRGASTKSLIVLLLFAVKTNVFCAPSTGGDAIGTGDGFDVILDDDGDNRNAAGFKRSAIRTTVVNLNDSNADDLFRNFNVSKDDIYRRLAQKMNAESPVTSTDNNNAGGGGAGETPKRNEEER